MLAPSPVISGTSISRNNCLYITHKLTLKKSTITFVAAGAYKAAMDKWNREPQQYACRAYLTARQELNVLSSLKHANVVALIGVCPRPLALVVALAPLGALSSLLHNYKRSGARLHLNVIQVVFYRFVPFN